jgi:hypothetical protein
MYVHDLAGVLEALRQFAGLVQVGADEVELPGVLVVVHGEAELAVARRGVNLDVEILWGLAEFVGDLLALACPAAAGLALLGGGSRFAAHAGEGRLLVVAGVGFRLAICW